MLSRNHNTTNFVPQFRVLTFEPGSFFIFLFFRNVLIIFINRDVRLRRVKTYVSKEHIVTCQPVARQRVTTLHLCHCCSMTSLRLRGSLFTGPSPRNGLHNTLLNLATDCLSKVRLRGNSFSISLPSNGLTCHNISIFCVEESNIRILCSYIG
jgi:hypothetical protein